MVNNNVGFFFCFCFITERGDGHRRKEWCTLAYWELGGRVGRLYPVESSTISVFDSLHDGDGLCLASLAENHDSVDDAKTTRSKIGLGVYITPTYIPINKNI